MRRENEGHSKLGEAEALQFLRAIESGEITLAPLDDPQEVYAGNVTYQASNGWRITIFNDANEWDYVDSIEVPDGPSLDYSDMAPGSELEVYDPGDDVAWSRYGIPGYCCFRCRSCSALLDDGPPFRPPFECRQCRSRVGT